MTGFRWLDLVGSGCLFFSTFDGFIYEEKPGFVHTVIGVLSKFKLFQTETIGKKHEQTYFSRCVNLTNCNQLSQAPHAI